MTDPDSRPACSFKVAGIGTGDSAEVIGDDVYIRATYADSKGYSDLNKIYKIELKTNETKKIVNTEVSRFRFWERSYIISRIWTMTYIHPLLTEQASVSCPKTPYPGLTGLTTATVLDFFSRPWLSLFLILGTVYYLFFGV
ncbi:hypothetical protein [Paenibacillus sp. V4I3]|uniref:hypothetical protein n=1 Tax=Paenibacillus sp. V4I3 TaxID=3042305 RepID=UPI0027D87B4A|nr:hypothetical protein [Paenibacillus sp. V4I3]